MTELERAKETRDALRFGWCAIERENGRAGLSAVASVSTEAIESYVRVVRMCDVWIREVDRLEAVEKKTETPNPHLTHCHDRIDETEKRISNLATVLGNANTKIERLESSAAELRNALSGCIKQLRVDLTGHTHNNTHNGECVYPVVSYTHTEDSK